MIISRGNKIVISNKIAQDAIACLFLLSFTSVAIGLLLLFISTTSSVLHGQNNWFFLAGAADFLISIPLGAMVLPFYDVIEIDRARVLIVRKWFGIEWSARRFEAGVVKIEVVSANQIGKWSIIKAIRINDSSDAVEVGEGYGVARLQSIVEQMRQLIVATRAIELGENLARPPKSAPL